MKRIYIIEDDENIRNLLSVALSGFGYGTEAFETAEEALARMEEVAPDLAIIDWMLPGMDGVEAIKLIREKKGLHRIPVMMLTAKDRELDKVEGLDGGADDYMVKPFGILELSARIRSLLRRMEGEKKEEGKLFLRVGEITADRQTREVFCSKKAVELTKKEYELLSCLMENHSRILTRDELLNRIWGYGYEGESRTLDMHIRTLRQKLGDRGACIKTIRGVGYRMVDAGESDNRPLP